MYIGSYIAIIATKFHVYAGMIAHGIHFPRHFPTSMNWHAYVLYEVLYHTRILYHSYAYTHNAWIIYIYGICNHDFLIFNRYV